MAQPKIMQALIMPNLRQLINAVNEKHIKREDIVSLIDKNNQYILVYYN